MSLHSPTPSFLFAFLLTGVVFLCPVTLMATDDINQNLAVSDVIFTASTGNLAFTVQNRGSGDLVAYIVDIIYLFPDGRKAVLPYLRDHTLELPMMGHVVAAPPGVHIGLIAPMGSESCELVLTSAPSQGKIVSVIIAPITAIFDDNIVAGDESRALQTIFRPHQALASIYKQYVATIQAVGMDTDIKAQADAIRQKYLLAGDGQDALGVDSDIYATIARSTYKQIGHDLDRVISRIDLGTAPPAQIFTAHVARMRELEAAYRTHSTPR